MWLHNALRDPGSSYLSTLLIKYVTFILTRKLAATSSAWCLYFRQEEEKDKIKSKANNSVPI